MRNTKQSVISILNASGLQEQKGVLLLFFRVFFKVLFQCNKLYKNEMKEKNNHFVMQTLFLFVFME